MKNVHCGPLPHSSQADKCLAAFDNDEYYKKNKIQKNIIFLSLKKGRKKSTKILTVFLTGLIVKDFSVI